jgi:hypothetical protein
VETVVGISLPVPDSISVVQGQTLALQATALGAGGVPLVGSGALQFTYSGVVTAASGVLAGGYCPGDCGQFSAPSEGTGQVNVTSGSVTASLQVTTVDGSAIDGLTFASSAIQVDGNGGNVVASYTATSAGTPVYGNGNEIQCGSSNQSIAAKAPGSFRSQASARRDRS